MTQERIDLIIRQLRAIMRSQRYWAYQMGESAGDKDIGGIGSYNFHCSNTLHGQNRQMNEWLKKLIEEAGK